MCLEPMEFGKSNRAIWQANAGNPFSLSPAPLAEAPPQELPNANAFAYCDVFTLSEFSDDFKAHQDTSYSTYPLHSTVA